MCRIKTSCKKIALLVSLLFTMLLPVNLSALSSKNIASQAEILKQAQEKNLAQDNYWKLLLHYQGDSSIVRSERFFLAKDGAKNPESELNATIKAFFDEDLSLKNNHAICRFPARMKWLRGRLNFSYNILPKVRCEEFVDFKYKLSANFVDVVFASEDVNSVVSMMGHIFLKISGDRPDGHVAHSLGYFAKFSKRAPLLSAIGSIYPGVEGLYVLEPYEKRRDRYNNVKKRNIWEYRLRLSPSQIEGLVFHLWELKEIDVKYGFVNHNCGSALLYLLYLAEPELQKVQKLNPLDAPIDIINDLNKAGYIEGAELVAAANYKVRMIEGNFNSDEKIAIKDFTKSGDLIFLKNGESLQAQANLAYGTQTYLRAKLIDEKINQEKYDILQEKIAYFTKKLPQNNVIYDLRNPLEKKGSSRIYFGYDNQNREGGIINFGFKPVYNDLISDNSNYFNEMELSLANIEGKYYVDEGVLRLDNLDLIKMKNIVPYEFLSGGISGSFKINLERQNFSSDSGKMFANTEFKIGIAKGLYQGKALLYSLAGAGYSAFKADDVFYANPEIGAILRWPKNIGKLNLKYVKFFAEEKYKYRDFYEIDQSFFVSKNSNFVLNYKLSNTEFEGEVRELGANYYYYF